MWLKARPKIRLEKQNHKSRTATSLLDSQIRQVSAWTKVYSWILKIFIQASIRSSYPKSRQWWRMACSNIASPHILPWSIKCGFWKTGKIFTKLPVTLSQGLPVLKRLIFLLVLRAFRCKRKLQRELSREAQR